MRFFVLPLRRIVFAFTVLVVTAFAAATADAQVPAITAVSAPRQVVTLGQNLTLSVTATGATSYQWKRNGLPLSGATAASYTITAAKPVRDNGWYQAVATNGSGSSTSAVVFVGVSTPSAEIVYLGNDPSYPLPAKFSVPNLVAIDVDAYVNGGIALKGDGSAVYFGNGGLNAAGSGPFVAIATG